MMFHSYSCSKGHAPSYRITRSDPDKNLLSLSMPCPMTGCDGLLELESKEHPSVKVLSARNLYQASMGHGLDDERICSPQYLKDFLHGAILLGINIDEENSDPNRSVVLSLQVQPIDEDSSYVLHFGSSTKGAVAYRLEKHDKAR